MFTRKMVFVLAMGILFYMNSYTRAVFPPTNVDPVRFAETTESYVDLLPRTNFPVWQDGEPNRQLYVNDEIIVKFKKPVSDTLERQLAGKAISKNIKLTKSLDNLNGKHKVKSIEPVFKDFKAGRERMNNLLKKDARLLSRDEKRILKRQQRAPKGAKVPELDRIYIIKLEEGQSAEQAVAEYIKDSAVEYAELNYIVSVNAIPNDPNYEPEQWSLNNIGQVHPIPGGKTERGTAGCDIHAQQAWDITTGASEVIVAVLDTGVDYLHPDLQNNIWTDANGLHGWDFCNDDNDPMDDYGHGTHCSGTIAADGNNSQNVAGVCWNAKIMGVKFLDSSGFGDTNDAVQGIYFAVDHDADIISNSWGGSVYSNVLKEAVEYAISNGVFVVAAAGNSGRDLPSFPAYLSDVMAVTATDHNDAKASFSSCGDWVEVAAPGVDILSLRAAGRGSSYYFYPYGDPNAEMYINSGTSMACPHVAGVAALCLSQDPNLSVPELWALILSGADDIGAAGFDPYFGAGRINAYSTLNLISNMPLAQKAVNPYPVDSDVNVSVNVHLSWEADTLASTHLVYFGTSFTDVNNATTSSSEFKGEVWHANFDPNTLSGYTTYYWRIDEKNPAGVIKGNVWSFTTGSSGIIYVDVNASGNNDGSSWQNAFTNLQNAINKAFSGDEIWVAAGTYLPTNGNDRAVSFALSGGLTLRGGFAGTESNPSERNLDINLNVTTLSGDIGVPDSNSDNSYHVLTVHGNYTETTVIDRIKAAYGNASQTSGSDSYGGGALILWGSIVNFKDCAFTNNFALNWGGAVYAEACGNIEFENCNFTENSASYGGGVAGPYILPNGPSFTKCVFEDNYANYGGGIFVWFCGATTLSECNISNNSAYVASGIGSGASPIIATKCEFFNNSVQNPVSSGSAIYCYPWASLSATDCNFIGNSTVAVTILDAKEFYAECDIRNCIFIGNGGGGLRFTVGPVDSNNMPGTVENCIFAENNGPGITCYFQPADISNCLFYGNVNSDQTRYPGGGISICSASPNISNCTFAYNSAAYGGAVYNYCYSDILFTFEAKPNISNCLMWGNTASIAGNQIFRDAVGQIPIEQSEPQIAFCDIQGCGGSGANWDTNLGTDLGGNIDSDPLFVDDNADDFHLLSTSPCIDAGDPNGDYTGQTDIDGQDRAAGIVEIGADELVRVYNQTQDAWYSTIQSAINDSSSGDVIVVSPGVYYENILYNCKTITIRSTDPNNWETVAATIIDGNNSGNVVGFYCNTCSTTTVLEGLTVRNSGETSCGILVFEDASPLIAKCIIEDNYNGIGCENGWPLITNNIIRNNSRAGLSAGGDAGPRIRNNLIYNNNLGMECEYYTQVTNNTVVNNRYEGIISYWGSEEETLNVKNCIVWGNGDDLSGCTTTYSCIEDGDAGEGNIDDDPLFVPNDDFYHLTLNSPCINAGKQNDSYTGQADIDGEDRVLGGIVDMGADELARVYNQTQDVWYPSIQSAIDDSSNGDEIIVYPGIYYEIIWWFGTGKITIRGSAPNNWETVAATIIDGTGNSDSDCVVTIWSDGGHVWPEEEGALFEGFTIRGGDSNGNYAAAMCYNATIRKCIVENNGDGIECGYYGIVGGNIIRNNSFAGIRSWGAFYIIKNNMIFNNAYGIKPWLYGTSTAQVINNTIVNNESAGIYCYGNGSAPDILNCILWDNGDDLYNCSATYSCIEDCNDIGNPYVTHNFCSNPLFVNSAGNNYHISSNSPCIDASDSDSDSYYAGWKDIDNENRVWIIDIGADEYYSY